MKSLYFSAFKFLLAVEISCSVELISCSVELSMKKLYDLGPDEKYRISFGCVHFVIVPTDVFGSEKS